MLRSRTLSVCALLLSMAATSTHAIAASPAPKTPVAAPAGATLSGPAKEAFESAKLLFGAGDFAGALVKFRVGYDLSKNTRLLWNMAVCEKNLRHYANVLRLTEQYLREGGTQLSEEDRRQGTDLLRALQPLVSSVKITVNEPGATILIDDQEIGTSPLPAPVLVDLGARRVRITKTGFDDAQVTANISGGNEGGDELRLTIERKKESERGRISVSVGTNDTIELDGRRVGVERWSGPVATGMHTIRVTGPDEKPAQQDVLVKDGETRTVQLTLEKAPKSKTWLWVTGGVVLAAGAAVGGYFLLKPGDQSRPSPPSGNLSPGLVQLP